ncbi:MAG TPA: hypothetical protein VNN79_20415 [Actinomycetota bacterium]|nr:hypothetical protein [Actinomycetota bacterium]
MTHVFRRSSTLVGLLTTIAMLTPSTAFAASPGDLDTTFGGGDGMATFSLSGSGEDLGTVLATTGGKILLFGQDDFADDLALARLSPNGDPDSTFGGGDGLVTLHFLPSVDAYNAVAALAGGKIMAAVDTHGAGNDVLGLARFTPDGDPDPSFGGGDGKLLVGFGKPFAAYDMVALPNGKLLVSGEFYLSDQDSEFMVVRLNANGSLDHAFGGGDGFVRTQFGSGEDGAWRMALDAHGRIVVAGWSREGISGTYDTAVARYTPDGSPDHTFSGDGKLTVNVIEGEDDYAQGLGIQGDKIVAGDYTLLDGNNRIAMIRRLPSGQPDPAFGGGDGTVITRNGTDPKELDDLAVDASNRIVISGSIGALSSQMFVARYGPNGELQTTFGTDGFGVTTFGTSVGNVGMSIAGNGKIVLGGEGTADASVARFVP